MPFWALLAAAIFLDGVLGDPFLRIHPIVWLGRAVAWSERLCRGLPFPPFQQGLCAWVLVMTTACGSAWAVLLLATMIHPWAAAAVSLWIMFHCFAAKSLQQHGEQVRKPLAEGSLVEARELAGYMVGRETGNLDEEGVSRAVVESLAENVVDGVTAPIFFALLGGPIGAIAYKAINTMDSMWGYKNERYVDFGCCAARLDDAANFIPARLTGLVLIVTAWLSGFDARRAWRVFWRDRLKHPSPNAAHGEAAVAGALGIVLGGENSYGGKVSRKPVLGAPGTAPTADHIAEAGRLTWRAGILWAVFAVVAAWFVN